MNRKVKNKWWRAKEQKTVRSRTATKGPSTRFMAQDALELVILSRLEEGESIPIDKKLAKLTKGATAEEILVSVAHNVSSAPLTPDVKAAFA